MTLGFEGLLALALAGAALPASPAHAAEETAWTLDSALKQIDESAKDFASAVADVERTSVEGEDAAPDTVSGKAYFSREGTHRLELSDPAEATILCTGADLYVYEPARAIVERYPLDNHPERLEPYATLGFSLTEREFSRDYVVGLLGEEIVDNRRTLLLELTPKSDELRATVSRIQLWIEQSSWLPLQQKVFHGGPSRHVTMRYLNASRNLPVDKDKFKPKWPKGTQTVKK